MAMMLREGEDLRSQEEKRTQKKKRKAKWRLNAGEVKELPIASCNIRESKKREIYMVSVIDLSHEG